MDLGWSYSRIIRANFKQLLYLVFLLCLTFVFMNTTNPVVDAFYEACISMIENLGSCIKVLTD